MNIIWETKIIYLQFFSLLWFKLDRSSIRFIFHLKRIHVKFIFFFLEVHSIPRLRFSTSKYTKDQSTSYVHRRAYIKYAVPFFEAVLQMKFQNFRKNILNSHLFAREWHKFSRRYEFDARNLQLFELFGVENALMFVPVQQTTASTP